MSTILTAPRLVKTTRRAGRRIFGAGLCSELMGRVRVNDDDRAWAARWGIIGVRSIFGNDGGNNRSDTNYPLFLETTVEIIDLTPIIL